MNNTTNSWELEPEVEVWKKQGRTDEQIYGVINFLTGQGKIMIDRLLHDTEIAAREYDGFDEMVRDFTSHGFMAKSEARRRFNTIIEQARKEAREETREEMIKKLKDHIGALDPTSRSWQALEMADELLTALSKEPNEGTK